MDFFTERRAISHISWRIQACALRLKISSLKSMLIKRAEQTSCRLTCFWLDNIEKEELVVCKNSKISLKSQDILNKIVWKKFKGFFLATPRSAAHMVSISGCNRPFSIFKDNHVRKLWEFGFFSQFLKIDFFCRIEHKTISKSTHETKISQSQLVHLHWKSAKF